MGRGAGYLKEFLHLLTEVPYQKGRQYDDPDHRTANTIGESGPAVFAEFIIIGISGDHPAGLGMITQTNQREEEAQARGR